MVLKLPFFKKKASSESIQLDRTNIPRHVAIIMDGNGRWAKKRGLPRVAGHKEGMNVVKKIVRRATDLNVGVLTLYAFSTENWKRPKNEVEFIMKLPDEFLNTYLPELIENNVRVQTIGHIEKLPPHTKKAVENAKDQTKRNTGLILNFALNYGGRDEIVQAVRQVAKDVIDENEDPSIISEEMIESHLYTHTLPDPDLLIRTSGEQRLSNYLLWQLAYAEFWFTEVLWPDFDEGQFEKALHDYQKRKRRYGGV
ncbi:MULTISPECIES: isoprenyl transferase [Pontibacillus]|uniref:Isoprenyl transferase n=1 Tax=Pontibacillus chungwhensis TaxID=265426 RepID=A0ABY8V236_9BACI|nr:MULTISPECIES: isoprenyl transferase [Pontibacillus]MCD5322716.1 isoprenyl transferase [Pontibacillus sp. HN14]WIF99992.1 isoprenyl transferase [Pontibacillus chungwhensis]